MSDPCEYCLNNQQDEYGSWYCAEGGALDEDEMARYLSHTTSASAATTASLRPVFWVWALSFSG